MKSDMLNRYYIECDCGSQDHLLIFDVDENNYSISACFTSNYNLVWYKRLWVAINYVLFKEYFCCYDDVIITEKNILQLESAIRAIKNLRKEN